jgi:hypothetical protein
VRTRLLRVNAQRNFSGFTLSTVLIFSVICASKGLMETSEKLFLRGVSVNVGKNSQTIQSGVL